MPTKGRNLAALLNALDACTETAEPPPAVFWLDMLHYYAVQGERSDISVPFHGDTG
jgi:hypothetical protein